MFHVSFSAYLLYLNKCKPPQTLALKANRCMHTDEGSRARVWGGHFATPPPPNTRKHSRFQSRRRPPQNLLRCSYFLQISSFLLIFLDIFHKFLNISHIFLPIFRIFFHIFHTGESSKVP